MGLSCKTNVVRSLSNNGVPRSAKRGKEREESGQRDRMRSRLSAVSEKIEGNGLQFCTADGRSARRGTSIRTSINGS